MIHNLVTGGSGFIGSHLVEALLAGGESVTVIDDLSTGAIQNLDGVRANPHLNVHVGSIMDVPLMTELVDRADRVWHLAAAVGVRLIVEKPVHTIETNIRGTEIVLSLAARKNRQLLITSTSEVYGKSTHVPFGEGDDLVFGSTARPRWAYACSKAIDEFLALAYHHEQQMPVVIARLFNTVGPRQTGQYGMVIPRFVRQAIDGQPMTIYGDGSQTRAFADVSDVITGITGLMAHPDAPGNVFNVGNDQEISVADLADRINKLCGNRSEITFVPFEKAYDKNFEDMTRRVPDLSKIRALTDYAPTRNIDQIIEGVIEWTRKQDTL